MRLDATGTIDPDGDDITYKWYPYREVGTFPLEIDSRNFELRESNTAVAKLLVPKVDAAKTVHIILEVRDKGEPALTSYRRVLMTIDPKAN